MDTDIIDGFSMNTVLAERDILRERVAELEAQLAAVRASVDVSGLPLRSINKRDMAATIMVQSLTIEHLEAQLAAVSPVGDEINLALIDDAEITALRAQLAAVQPWAEVGKRAIRNGWWIDYGRLTADGVFCRICQIEMPDDEDGYPYHPDTTNCVIPALFAQLEADNA